jgi:N-acetylglutamate synthase-like GNAT family acetyltransferase
MPWLGSLIVDKGNQGRGIGALLIDATKNKAKDMGFDKLYLVAVA